MYNHTLYNIIKDKLSPKTRKQLEEEMEYYDNLKKKEYQKWNELT